MIYESYETPESKNEALGVARRQRALEQVGDPDRVDRTLSKEAYVSQQFADLEAERMWPKVWQIACRLEELPNVGDFHEHNIVNDSIIVVRSAPDTLKAYYNVCQHRARKLVHGSGNVKNFFCLNHGWRWNLDGKCSRLVDQYDWKGLRKEDVPLPEVKVDTWGGWVFINQDPNSESLLDYLSPVPDFLDPFEFDRMRMTWHHSITVNCNWKTMLDAFVEQYHVPTVHHESGPYSDTYAVSCRRGKHSQYTQTADSRAPGVRPNLSDAESAAIREPRTALIEMMALIGDGLEGMWSPRMFEEATKLADLPEGMSHMEVYLALVERVQKRAAEEGTGGATLTLEQMGKGSGLWHVFPNHSTLPTNDGAIAYRMRPNGTDPHSMIVDLWGLAFFIEGQEPEVKHDHFDRWDTANVPWMLKQDYSNVEEVHKGMLSRGLDRVRVNPVQESNISNYHDTLRGYLFGANS